MLKERINVVHERKRQKNICVQRKQTIGVKFQATVNSKSDQSKLDQSTASSFWLGCSDVRCVARGLKGKSANQKSVIETKGLTTKDTDHPARRTRS
jgi:hypothetical protein